MPTDVRSLPREMVPTQRKTRPADRVTLYYRHIDVEVDQKTITLARRHIQRLPVGTMRSLRRSLVLSLDAIADLEEAGRLVDAMDTFCIDLIFLQALDECLLDCEERLLIWIR